MSTPTGHHLIHSEAFVDQGEPVASTSEFAPKSATGDRVAATSDSLVAHQQHRSPRSDCAWCPESSLTPEQDLRAAVAERLTDAIHFNGCTDEPCTCLVGRLHWAINAEQVAS